MQNRARRDTVRAMRTIAALVCSLSGWVLAGCDDSKPSAEPQTTSRPGRVVAVAAKEPAVDPVEEFCDVRPKASAKPFSWPDAVQPTPRRASGWEWVNLWATWCKPCVEEIPMLQGWQKKLSADSAVSLSFVSVDETPEAVDQFRSKHPGMPPSARLIDAEQLAPWIGELGLDPGATLPIHVFINPRRRIRCIRTGSVDEKDYSIVQRVLSDRS